MADLKRRIIAEFSAKNKAKGVMAGFGRDMDTVGRTMRRMAVGALAAAGVGGLGYMLKKQMEIIDATAKLSDRLGMSTEALIGMQHGANIAGVESETLNKALSTLSSRLGEVDMGVGQATYALEKLGLNYKDLIGLDMDEAIGIVADQIRSLSTQSEKAAAANYLFGKSGKQLLNLFEEGSAGVAKYQEEVRKLGLSFSRIDAAQVEAANDALTRARAVMTGLFRTATIELAPYIGALADKFVDVATAGEGMGVNVVNVFESISLAAIRLGDIIHGLSAKFMAFQAGALEGAASILEISAKIEKYSLGWGVGVKLGRKALGVEGPAEIAKRYRERAAKLMEGAGQAAVSTYGQENAVKRFYDNLRKQADAWQVEYDAKAKKRAAAGVGIGPPEEEIDAMQKHRMEMLGGEGGTLQEMEWRRDTERIRYQMEADAERIHAKTEAEKAAAQEIGEVWTEMWLKEEKTAYHAMRAPIIEAEKTARESAERRKRIAEDIAMSMAQSWTSAIDQMMFEGKKFWDAMEDMARSLTRMIANILIYRGVAEPIATGIMGTESAQHGGVFTRPTLVQAGEVPEAFVPLRSGKIPVEMRGGAAGESSTLEMNVHYHGQEKPKITRAEEYLLSNRRIINVTLQALQTDANYRRGVAQVK